MKITLQQAKDLLFDETKSLKWKSMALYRLFSMPENFEVFCRFCLPKAFTKPFVRFHNEIIDEFMQNKNSAVAAPRGHGKSTLIGQGLVIWNILYRKKKYIIYISQNYSKSVQFIEPISKEFKFNKMIRFIYGNMHLNTIKDEEADNRDREDMFDINGVRIQALSFENNIRGLKYGNQRPDLIILDDIEDDQRVLNAELRLKDSNKLNKEILPSVDAETGVIKYIGTILHHDSLLVNSLRKLDGKTYRACEFDSEGKIIPGSILFPDLYSEKTLLSKRKEMGSTPFESEYLNNPIDNVASVIKREWVEKCKDDTISYGDIKDNSNAYLGCDFAFGDRITNDKSAFVDVRVYNDKKYINGIYTYKGLSVLEQFDIISDLYKKEHFVEIVMEENSIKSISKELYTYDFPYYLIWTGSSDSAARLKPDVPFEDKRHTIGKKAMILRLATEFESGNMVIPYKTDEDKQKSELLIDELVTFALDDGKLVEVGKHSDIGMGLGMALERLNADTCIIDL